MRRGAGLVSSGVEEATLPRRAHLCRGFSHVSVAEGVYFVYFIVLACMYAADGLVSVVPHARAMLV